MKKWLFRVYVLLFGGRDDLISSLPEELICHILSFLPTKQGVATSVLSQKWKSLWRSVPSLDFDDSHIYRKDTYHRFVQAVYAVIFSRDPHLPIQKFRLTCYFLSYDANYDPANITDWVNAAVQRRVHHLDLSLSAPYPPHPPPNLSSIYTCKTLVVLKLHCTKLEPISSVDLPFLKVMHLHYLRFSKCACLAQLLSGCPLLEDFKARYLDFHKYVTDTEFKTLPKLLRAAHLSAKTGMFLLGVVSNVKFLRIDGPRLSIYESELRKYPAIWQYPPFVPKCILLHLKSCCLNHYIGANGEFQFARYIMQNGRFLERMTICSDITMKEQGKLKMLEKLSSCTRSSATCKLSFK